MSERQDSTCLTFLQNGQNDVIGWHLYDKMPVQDRASRMAASSCPRSKAEQLLGVLSSHPEVSMTLWPCCSTLESAASCL